MSMPPRKLPIRRSIRASRDGDAASGAFMWVSLCRWSDTKAGRSPRSIVRARLEAAVGGAARLVLRRLPVGSTAEPGALQHLERQQRALHPSRGYLDAEQLEDELLVELHQVVDRHSLDLVGDHRGGGLR